MKLKFNSFLFVLALGCTFSVNAQNGHFNCGQHTKTQELWEKNPQMKAERDQFVANVIQNIEINPVTQKATLIIPLVFHIVHEYGFEDVSDAQIYDQVAVLNRDYRKLNADISELVAGFDTIAADVNIEFRLATIDPAGNCTNGIEHIYSHETNNGDDYAKHNQWHRSRYLNVWLVKAIVSSDGSNVAGYAYHPSNDLEFFRDGVIILHSSIGRIGTGSENSSRALTHEIGHYLGLDHPWGGTNNPGVSCGDDGITDTPITKGYNLFCPANANAAKICDANIVENYQNYMDYSYCSVMFTKKQALFMRNVLTQSFANRDSLVTPYTHQLTGALVSPAPTCTPVADFDISNKFVCEGTAVAFKDFSWNAPVVSRMWYFEGGTPATSTAANPSVTFSGLGWKTVKLVVTNATGSDSIVAKNIHVSQSWADKTGPYTESFESGNIVSWLVDNPENNYAGWKFSNTNGKDNSKCMVLNNYRDVSAAQQYSENYFYNFRLGGNKDALITPSFDLTSTSSADLVFDYAYASSGSTLSTITEQLKIYVSKDCGKSWTLRKTMEKTELLTGGNSSGIEFKPTTNTMWKTGTVPINITNSDTRTRFKFEFNASDVANNLYLDNIKVTGILTVAENPLNTMDLSVYPNPTSGNQGISINYVANENPVEFQLMDVQGKILTTETNNSANSEVTHKLELASPLAAGCYYLKVAQGEFNITKKVVVL